MLIFYLLVKIICALQETWALGTALVEFNDFDIDAHCNYIIRREGPHHDKLYHTCPTTVWFENILISCLLIMFKHPVRLVGASSKYCMCNIVLHRCHNCQTLCCRHYTWRLIGSTLCDTDNDDK